MVAEMVPCAHSAAPPPPPPYSMPPGEAFPAPDPAPPANSVTTTSPVTGDVHWYVPPGVNVASPLSDADAAAHTAMNRDVSPLESVVLVTVAAGWEVESE